MPFVEMCCRGISVARTFARYWRRELVGWVAAYDFDFSEPSSPQRLPTRENDRSEDRMPTMDRKPY